MDLRVLQLDSRLVLTEEILSEAQLGKVEGTLETMPMGLGQMEARILSVQMGEMLLAPVV